MSTSKETENIDYSFPKLGKGKLIFTAILLVLFFAIYSFPIVKTLDNTINKALKISSTCRISYKNYGFELFLPKLVINKLKIPAGCFDSEGNAIVFDKVNLLFRGLSFAPFGPSFKLETNIFKNEVSAYIAAGISGIAVNIQENTIDISKLVKNSSPLKIDGKLLLNTLVKSNYSEINELKLIIQSKDLMVPEQKIMGLTIPKLDLKNFYVKANTSQKNKIKVSDLILGDTQAQIRANFKGNISPNLRNMLFTNFDLKGEIAFDKNFIESFAIIKLFMNKFTKKDEFYQMRISGSLKDFQSPDKISRIFKNN